MWRLPDLGCSKYLSCGFRCGCTPSLPNPPAAITTPSILQTTHPTAQVTSVPYVAAFPWHTFWFVAVLGGLPVTNFQPILLTCTLTCQTSFSRLNTAIPPSHTPIFSTLCKNNCTALARGTFFLRSAQVTMADTQPLCLSLSLSLTRAQPFCWLTHTLKRTLSPPYSRQFKLEPPKHTQTANTRISLVFFANYFPPWNGVKMRGEEICSDKHICSSYGGLSNFFGIANNSAST